MSTSSGSPNTATAEKWGEQIDGDRIQELRRLLDAPERKDEPFAGVSLTGADVYWLVKYALATGARGATGGPTMKDAEKRLEDAKDNPLLRSSLDLHDVNLCGAILAGAKLEGAILGKAQLDGVIAGYVNLKGAYLSRASLIGAFLDRATLDGAVLRKANLKGASLWGASLKYALLDEASLEHAILRHSTLQHANLQGASACDADFTAAKLARAYLAGADLTKATFYEAHLEHAIFSDANLTHADLRRARLDDATRFNEALLNGAALDQTNLAVVNLAVVDWQSVKKLADEQRPTPADADPRAERAAGRGLLGAIRRSSEKFNNQQELFSNAARAYRSLSVALRNQGLATDATRYHYRAEVMQRQYRFNKARYLLRTRNFWRAPGWLTLWALSFALSFFAGYGVYHLWRLLVTYVVVILAFATLFFFSGPQSHEVYSMTNVWPNAWDALTFSLTSFHGRGLAPPGNLSVLLRVCAGVEAICGLLIEGLLIAAFTRRVTGL